MEPFGVFADGEWESFSKMFSTEEFDFTQQFLGQCNAFPQQHDDQGLHFITPSTFCHTSEANLSMAGVNDSLFYSSNTLNSNLQNLSQDSSFGSNCSTSVFFPHETAYFASDSNHSPMTNDVSMSMDICVMDEKKIGLHGPAFHDIAMEETAGPTNQYMSGDKSGNLDNGQPATGVVPAKELQIKRKFDLPALYTGEDDRVNVNSSENTKKKPRGSRNVEKTNKKNVQSKKNQNLSPKGNDGEESNGGSDGQSSSSYSSEEDNASQETNGGSLALNLNGKPRASRGSATDPQSIYARKRRERINERLKILQNLVPNGTKVDISTMLEEAVHYVKFMQLQIKLLSSDDLWMYAPIAYNGIDVFLNQKISSLL